VQGFELGGLDHGRQDRRQRVRDQAASFSRVPRLAHGPERHQVAALLREAAHQVEDAIDDPHARLQPSAPMSIARTSSRPASATLSDPVKREDHDQPEQHLGDALVRLEDAFRGRDGDVGHGHTSARNGRTLRGRRSAAVLYT